ncbi:DUF1015 domain-containing protein, partial [Dehalococcoidales bacterium]|nr:DUF1015 domain-containing protein [Dehalococcoidales bacterium]
NHCLDSEGLTVAEIRPFRGVYYNQLLFSDLSPVICPPYDIITPQLQQELYHRSQYNFVRIEHPQELPQANKYTRAAATLEQWLKQGVLKVDEVPAIYLHDHYFTHQGKEYRRRGIIVTVRLGNKMVIRPHEDTLAEPKADRLNLLRACQANTSPILALFEDRGQQVASVLAGQERNKPIISSSGGESHNVWAITEPEAIDQLCHHLAHQPLYIADGHHRYQSALIYQRERKEKAFNFVLTELVDFSDPGLIILPPHRLIRGVSKSTLNGLMVKLKSFFEIEELPLSLPNIWQKVDEPLPDDQVKLVLFGLTADHLSVLKLSDFTTASQMMPYSHCQLYQRLDVCIIEHIILEKLLGLGSSQEEATLDYSYDRLDAVNRVLAGEYQLAFLLSPVKVEVVKAIADAGDRLPRKSTYFYPKAPAGLIFHRLV